MSRHIAITGASAGIGAALARSWARQGDRITLVARSEDKLRALAASLDVDTHVAPTDLCDTARAADWIAAAEADLGPIDVLVNNAGQQVIGPTHTIDLDHAERSLALNLLTPLRLMRTVLPSMRERGGTIVNVASMAALAPTPGMTWYNAGKCGLAGASESLRGELADTPVDVVTVYPGIIADTDMGRDGLEAYDSGAHFLVRMQPSGTADALADVIVRAANKGQARVIWPRANAVARHFPAATRWAMDTFTPVPQ